MAHVLVVLPNMSITITIAFNWVLRLEQTTECITFWHLAHNYTSKRGLRRSCIATLQTNQTYDFCLANDKSEKLHRLELKCPYYVIFKGS